ncbi:MAG TPA: hypothetical protein VGG64_15660 [Pirellulales bacterium]
MDLDRFLELATESGVITADALQQALSEFTAAARARRSEGSPLAAFSDFLVSGNLLTRWQCDMLLAGRSKEFFLGKFKFLKQIGNDGLKETFLAEDMSANRRVILSFGVEATDAAATVFQMRVVDPEESITPATNVHSLPAQPVRHRRFQFGLGTLLVIMAVLGIVLAIVGREMISVRERSTARAWLLARGAWMAGDDWMERGTERPSANSDLCCQRGDVAAAPSAFAKLLGDRVVKQIWFPGLLDQENQAVFAAFPEATIYVASIDPTLGPYPVPPVKLAPLNPL